jgi:hypothetical protein
MCRHLGLPLVGGSFRMLLEQLLEQLRLGQCDCPVVIVVADVDAVTVVPVKVSPVQAFVNAVLLIWV